MIGIEDVVQHACAHEHKVDCHRTPPQVSLPTVDLQVPKHSDANQKPGQRSACMRDVADLIERIVNTVVDRNAQIRYAKHEKHKQLHDCVLHLAPVLERFDLLFWLITKHLKRSP